MSRDSLPQACDSVHPSQTSVRTFETSAEPHGQLSPEHLPLEVGISCVTCNRQDCLLARTPNLLSPPHFLSPPPSLPLPCGKAGSSLRSSRPLILQPNQQVLLNLLLEPISSTPASLPRPPPRLHLSPASWQKYPYQSLCLKAWPLQPLLLGAAQGKGRGWRECFKSKPQNSFPREKHIY